MTEDDIIAREVADRLLDRIPDDCKDWFTEKTPVCRALHPLENIHCTRHLGHIGDHVGTGGTKETWHYRWRNKQ